jgi:hypothetical protein
MLENRNSGTLFGSCSPGFLKLPDLEGVVIAFTLATHTLNCAVYNQKLLEITVDKLNAPISMNDQSGLRSAQFARLFEGIHHTATVETITLRRADDRPEVQVLDHRLVKLAFIGRNIGDIRYPDSVRMIGSEDLSQ